MRILKSTERPRLPFTVSVVKNTALDGKLCKVYRYDATAEALECETNAYLVTGSVNEESFESIGDFMLRRQNLESSEALMLGRPIYSPATVRTQKVLRDMDPDTRREQKMIARDREHVSWSDGPSLGMLDFDSPGEIPAELEDRVPVAPEGLRKLILDCIPGLQGVPMAWAPSSSSQIFCGDQELHGLRGQRFYFVLQSGAATEQFKIALRNALALKGLVWYQVSKSGSLLERYPFDLMVYQPERLDFAAGAECQAPLEWRPDPCRIWDEEGAYLTEADLPTFSEADLRRIESIRRDRRRAKASAARETKERWTEETGRRIALHHPELDHAQAANVARQAVDRGVLLPEFILTGEEGKSIRVGALLADPQAHDQRRFHDPLEPGYRNDPRIAVFLVDEAGRCRIFSHAHGGQAWRCEVKLIPVRLGLIDESVDQIKGALEQDTCNLYRHGDTLVHVDPVAAEIQTIDADGLALRLQRTFDVVGRGKSGLWIPKNIPTRDLNALMSEMASLPIPKLAVVSKGPFARSDGSAVDVPGYDVATEVLYLSSSESPPRVRQTIGIAQAEEALLALMEPFSAFPFKSDLDRGVFLAALLSSVTRLSLPIAPAYLITAPTAGSGKTTLAEAIGALQTGSRIAAAMLPEHEEEIRKQVFAALREGSTFLLYDNIERGSHLKSPAIATLLTGPFVGQRILGYSTNEQRPNRLTMVFTGNNIATEGDLIRRILPIHLDPEVEHPERRTFAFDPVSRILADNLRLRIAALEVIGGWREDGAKAPEGTIGMTEWNHVIRGTVLWAACHLDVGIGFEDPAKATLASYSEDPESQVLGDVLEAWDAVFDDREIHLKEIDDVLDAAEADELDSRTPAQEDHHARCKALADARRAAVPSWRAGGQEMRTAFGRYLSTYNNRVIRGLKLVKSSTVSGGARRWRVCRVGADSAAA